MFVRPRGPLELPPVSFNHHTHTTKHIMLAARRLSQSGASLLSRAVSDAQPILRACAFPWKLSLDCLFLEVVAVYSAASYFCSVKGHLKPYSHFLGGFLHQVAAAPPMTAVAMTRVSHLHSGNKVRRREKLVLTLLNSLFLPSIVPRLSQ